MKTTLAILCLAIGAFAAESQHSARITAGNEFREIPSQLLYVMPDSALDLSGQIEWIPAGTLGRLIINAQGEFAFEKAPQKAVRFFCCSFAHHEEIAFRCYSYQELDAFADAIKRQGYNMIRFHYLDDMLTGSKRGVFYKDWETRKKDLPQTADDVLFEERTLDRFFYFIAACAKRGIYVNLDLMSAFTGMTNGTTPLASPQGPDTSKMQMFTNEAYRKNYIAWVTRLLTTINPYTGKELRNDPTIAIACCLNEQEILMDARDYSSIFHTAWPDWLKKKYKTIQALQKAWNKPNLRSFEEVPPISTEATQTTPTGRDMAMFCAEQETALSLFYIDELKKIAPNLLISNWNMRPRFMEVPARSHMNLIMQNYYHAHPLYGGSLKVPQDSAFVYGGNIVKQFATMRFLDRPFVSTEYGITFWNQYRHEQGLMCGAAAALQGWSCMTTFSSPVVYGMRPMENFHTGTDPIIRAAQLVEFFAFRRGDVASSRNTVEFSIDDELIFSGNATRGIGDSLARLWAVCRIGLSYGQPQHKFTPALKVRPGKTSAVSGDGNYSTTSLDISSEEADAVIDKLRAKKILSDANRTNAAEGIFESDTQQIYVNMARREMNVVTPRLGGAILKTSHGQQLDALSIQTCSVPAAITAISLDSQSTISQSNRLLLVIATNALNTDMEFSGPDRETLRNAGSLPVLLSTGQFACIIRREAKDGAAFHCYALDLSGKRIGDIPLSHQNGDIVFFVNTATSSSGPSIFYELVIEK